MTPTLHLDEGRTSNPVAQGLPSLSSPFSAQATTSLPKRQKYNLGELIFNKSSLKDKRKFSSTTCIVLAKSTKFFNVFAVFSACTGMFQTNQTGMISELSIGDTEPPTQLMTISCSLPSSVQKIRRLTAVPLWCASLSVSLGKNTTLEVTAKVI